MVSRESLFALMMALSGAAALVYETLWVRQLSVLFGSTAYAVATTVAAFMAGLALGSVLIGKRADARSRPLRLYLLLEAGIALSAVGVTLLMGLLDDTLTRFIDVEMVAASGWGGVRFAVAFTLLAGPAALMGGTLPTLARAARPELAQVGKTVGGLYAANTYGGVVGAFLTGFWLIPTLGTTGALGAAVGLNVLCAGLAALAARRPTSAPVAKSAPHGKKGKRANALPDGASAHSDATTRPESAPLALWLYFISGFTALAYETLWTRAFVVSFKSSVYLFSNLLAVFLLGMALGSHLYSRRIDRLASPMTAFGLSQVVIGLLGMGGVFLIHWSPGVFMSFAREMGEMTFAKDALVTLGLMIVCFLPAAIVMGVAYPLICKVVTRSVESEGRSFGKTYAIGSLGAIFGALGAGFVILPALGLQNGIFLVSAVSIGAGAVALLKSRTAHAPFWVIPATAFASLALFASATILDLDIGMGASTTGKVLYKNEGVTGTVRVTQEGENGPLTLLVNNYQLATSGDVAIRFGHLPFLMKPDAKEVALISLGSGITAGGVASHDVTRIDCVEIVPALIDIQPFFAPYNRKVTEDPRFHLTFWDGRHYMAATRRSYDLVIADLFQPDSAGIGALYTREHFERVKEKLAPGGMMAQWLPLYQLSPESLKIIMKTFSAVFPHVTVWFGDVNSELPTLMLAGSAGPFAIDPARLYATLNDPRVRRDMIEKDDPLSFLSFFVFDREGLERYAKDAPLNTDRRPLIEYLAPRRIWERRANAVENFESLMRARRPVTALVLGADRDPELKAALDRYFKGRTALLEGKIAYAQRNFPDALTRYQQAARLAPHDPFLALSLFDMGYLYYHRRDYASAATLFDWAAKVNGDLVEARFYLAKAYQYAGDQAASQKVISELVRERPDIAREMFQGS
ncbi:MAG: fused MFS/spermidine synthase [Nitrospinae bacterium]|nr:fused MFS/spermidine synthase [Nitrospinota bacterium]